MPSMLFVIATGPENPTRAALGLLLARTAASEGHDVTVFFAGDGVVLVRPETAAEVRGVGLGQVDEHLAALREAEVPIHLSRLSSEARGLDQAAAGDAQMSRPQDLVELAVSAETTLTF